MNIADFQQGGGFPFETNTLDFMQTSYKLFNDLGAVVGDKTIIKGCVLTGSTVSDGTIYLNGELLEFRGGIQQSKIIVREDIVSMEFEVGGAPKEVYKTRYAQFGTGVGAINWSEFKRIDPIILMMAKITELEKKTAIFQAGGGMFFWNRPVIEIPPGYQEVEDWAGRIPVNLDISQEEFNTIGKTGGEKSMALTVGQLPKHTPTGSTTASGGHTPTGTAAGPYVGTNISGGGAFDGGSNKWKNRGVNMNAVPNHVHGVNFNEIGNNEKHNNLSPYKVALFIEYID